MRSFESLGCLYLYELFSAFYLQPGITDLLDSDGAVISAGDILPADTAGSMSRADDDAVAQR